MSARWIIKNNGSHLTEGIFNSTKYTTHKYGKIRSKLRGIYLCVWLNTSKYGRPANNVCVIYLRLVLLLQEEKEKKENSRDKQVFDLT